MSWVFPGMETPLDVLSRAASLVHADDEKREAALRSDPRMQPLPMPSLTNHRTGPPPISPKRRKCSMDQGDDELDCENDHVSKMSRMFSPHLTKGLNGDYRKDPRDRSRSPIERAAAPTMGLHNRPSVITCAPPSNRNCNLSHCPVSHSGCVSAVPANFRRPSNTLTACDPVVEEHFRRSLGKNYKEPEPVANSVSITGSVDDHFAKALGETWLQIKAAKDVVSSSPESASRRGQSSPSSHMVNHNHSPSVLS
ncbi:transcription cofactor vestigial-like protein 4 isoform X4 [Dendrobates tinctorius]|uniref:transcription cofactor vestigial-like protein 4 isoform X4 n=1 Tax=Dendrobates tinctorius TaxID=92724 RepID=UPI003CC99837